MKHLLVENTFGLSKINLFLLFEKVTIVFSAVLSKSSDSKTRFNHKSLLKDQATFFNYYTEDFVFQQYSSTNNSV